jgi:hypothetical protein
LMVYRAMRDEIAKIAGVFSKVPGLQTLAKLENPIEVGGLGILAAPNIDNMIAKHRARRALGLARGAEVPEEAIEQKRLIKERFHDPVEVGGLGILAAPLIAHRLHSGGWG